MSLRGVAALCVLLLALLAAASAYTDPDRVHLRDIPSLLFVEGKQTQSRRGKYYPQLVRTGGSAPANAEQHLANVLCTNKGFDGRNVNWRCEANLPDWLALGKFEILCEGFEGPNDEYSLRGSCSLEYQLNAQGQPGPRGDAGPVGTGSVLGQNNADSEVIAIVASKGLRVVNTPGYGIHVVNDVDAKIPLPVPTPPREGYLDMFGRWLSDLWEMLYTALFWAAVLGVLVLVIVVLSALDGPNVHRHHEPNSWWYTNGGYSQRTTVVSNHTHVHTQPSASCSNDYSVQPPPSSARSRSWATTPSVSYGSSSNRSESSMSSDNSTGGSGSGKSTSSSSGSSRNR